MLKLLAKETTARQQMARLLDPEANFVEDQLLDKENELLSGTRSTTSPPSKS